MYVDDVHCAEEDFSKVLIIKFFPLPPPSQLIVGWYSTELSLKMGVRNSNRTALSPDTCVSTNIEAMLRMRWWYLVTEPLPKICKAMDSIYNTVPQHTLSKRKRELFCFLF